MLSVHVSPDKVEHHNRNQMALMPVLIRLKIEGPCKLVADHLYLDLYLSLLSVFVYNQPKHNVPQYEPVHNVLPLKSTEDIIFPYTVEDKTFSPKIQSKKKVLQLS